MSDSTQITVQEVSEHERRCNAIARIMSASNTTLGTNDTIREIAASLQDLIPCDRLSLGVLQRKRWYLYEEGRLLINEFNVPVSAEDTASGWVIHSRRPMVRRNISEEVRFNRDFLRLDQGEMSDLIVPLIVDDEVAGTINFTSRAPCRYDEGHLATAQSVAEVVAVALKHFQTCDEMEAIREISSAVMESRELDDILRMILTHIQSQGYDRVRLYLVDRDAKVMRGAVQVGMESTSKPFASIVYPIGTEPFPWRHLTSGRPRLYRPGTPEYKAVSRSDREIGVFEGTASLQGEWCEIPLKVVEGGQDTIVGDIALDNEISKRPMVKDRVDRLMVYASHAALAIRHAQLYGEMAQEVEARTGQLGRQNREQEALLDINRAVQEMRGAPDLERVARVCYEQLKALKMDFQGLAIQRLMDEDEADFEIFELRTSGRFSRWRSPSPNLLRIWSAGKIDYRKDMDRDLQGHSAEPLALVRERYGLDIRCVLDVPHARGTLALLSTTPNAFSDSEISFTERVAEVLSVGLARLGDLQQVEASREAQAESQRYAQRIADAIPSVLYVYDLSEQRLSYVNDQVSRVLGYSAKAVQELGAGVVELLHPEDRDPVVEHLERLGEADDAEVFDIDYRMRHANGEWRWLRSRDVIFARGPDGSARQLLGTALDITERRAAATRLARYQGQLRSLSSELTLTEERERRRIATDLHDEIGQILAVTKIKLGALQATPTATDLGEALSEVRGLIDRAIQEARSLTFDLSLPVLYELGFEAALEWLVEQVQSEFGLQVRHSDDGEPKPLDDDVKVLVFRAVRELLYNAAKHAKVSEVQLTTRRVDSQLRIEVLDHGVGFDTEAYAVDVAEGFGLFSIRERLSFMGGEFLIESEPGQGTRAVLAAPMKGYVPPTDRENA